MGESVPFAEWAGELCYRARLSWRDGAEAKASLNRANKYDDVDPKPSVNSASKVSGHRPETGWPIHEQAEVALKRNGGPNPRTLQCPGMTCG